MTKEEFIVSLDQGARQAAALPVTGAILRWTADQLRAGDPPWWKKIQKAWDKRSFASWSEAWSLYVACLHFEALSDADNPLVPFFPSCGGTAEADPAVGLARFLAAAGPEFFELLSTGQRRTYIPGRDLMWTAPAMLFFQRRDLPYYLVEVNAGAGLNLAADMAHPLKGFDGDLVAARVGLDTRPLALEDIADRRWLTAGVWPDDLGAIKALDDVADTLLARIRAEPTFIQLAPCAAENAAAFLTQNVPADDPETGLLIFNMGTTARMTDAQYAAFAAALGGALKPWGDRALWMEVESVRAEAYSSTYQLRLHRMIGGALKSLVMASVEIETGRHNYNPASADFLGPTPSAPV